MDSSRKPVDTLQRIRVRPFTEGDYGRAVEVHNLTYPDSAMVEEELRHYDAAWEHDRYVRERVVAEDDTGYVVGTGRYNHVPDEFHPDKYAVDIIVDPAARRRGVGRALYEHLIAGLRARNALAARSGVREESDTESLAFLQRRGFVETHRGWQSRLDVRAFDFQRFAAAGPRAAADRITVTTLGAEMARDPDALRKTYDLQSACERDVPSADPVTPVSFEFFLAHTTGSPGFLPDAYFLAKDGDRYVALSALWRGLATPGVIHQGLTGALREYRGRGIAMALKVETVRYARDHGYHEIRTWNDSRNRPMLRINEAMGFMKRPAFIGMEKPVREQPPA